MKTCTTCGGPLNDEKFCPNCGAKISENSEKSNLEPKPLKQSIISKKIAIAMEILYLLFFVIFVRLAWSDRLFSNQWSTIPKEGITMQGFFGILIWNILWFVIILILLAQAKNRSGKKNSPVHYIVSILFFVIVLLGSCGFAL